MNGNTGMKHCKESMVTSLLHLMRKQWVTPIDALGKAGCMSLAQRVSELTREGVCIHKRWVHLPNGKRCMAYRLG